MAAVMLLPTVLVVAPALVTLAPTASAQIPLPDYRIDKFSVGLQQGKNATFVPSATTLVGSMELSNHGSNPGRRVPVIVYAQIDHGPGAATRYTYPTESRACVLLRLGEGVEKHVVNLDVQVPTPPMPETPTEDQINQARAHFFFFANRWPTTAEAPGDFPRGSTLLRGDIAGCNQDSVVDESDTVTLGALDRSGDNKASRFVIADRKLNLQPTSIEICNGAETLCYPTAHVDAFTAYNESAAEQLRMKFALSFAGSTYANVTDPNTGAPWVVRTHIIALQTNSSTGTIAYNGTLSLDTAGNAGASPTFPLIRKAGLYNFTVHTDPLGVFPETSEADNRLWIDMSVRAPDLLPRINATNLKTSPTDPYTYGGDGLVSIPVRVHLTNQGDHTAVNRSGGVLRPFPVRVYVDSVSSDSQYLWYNVTENALGVGVQRTYDFTIRAYDPDSVTSPPDNTKPLRPGEHKLIFLVDSPCPTAQGANCAGLGKIYEGNEANNRHEVSIFVLDTRKPTVKDLVGITVDEFQATAERAAGNDTAVDLTALTGRQVSWRVHATDDDANLSVKLIVVPPTGNTTRTNMTKWKNASGGFDWTHVLNQTYTTPGVYTVKVEATDSANNIESSKLFQLKVKKWDIQSKKEATIVLQDIANGTSVGFDPDGVVLLRFQVFPNDTGFYPAHSATGKEVHVFFPDQDDPTKADEDDPTVEPLTSERVCSGGGLPWPGGPSCTNEQMFRASIVPGIVGKHNVSVRFADVSGAIRYINRTFDVAGPRPVIENVTELPNTIDAGARLLNVSADVSDSFGVRAMHFTFNKIGSSYERNFTMDLVNGTRTNGTYRINVTTGFGEGTARRVDHAGTFRVSYAAQNDNFDWTTITRIINITDTQAPVLRNPAATPNPQEVSTNVTFFTTATDNSNFTVRLVIKRGTETFDDVGMKRVAGTNNYSFTRMFAQPGSYSFTIQAKDSVNLTSEPHNGILTVAQNLPPRFSILSPSFVDTAKTRFSDANPRFRVLIEDRDLVQEATVTINLTRLRSVGAPETIPLTAATFEESRDPKGLVATFTLATGAPRLTHNTTLVLNMSARDTTGRLGFLASTDQRVRIDATPPTSAATPTFEGATYRERDDGPVFLAEATGIRFTATENQDDAQTRVQTIEFNVLRPGLKTSRTFTYAPGSKVTFEDLFKAPYEVQNAGPGVYRLRYWATDAVGNVETPQREFEIHLDSLPPRPNYFETRPQGKFINATWADEESGVSRTVAYYNVNGGVFTVIPLTEANGVWSGVVPEGRSGDTVCYYLQAFDRVENVANLGNQTAPFTCYPVGNQLPQLRLLEPGDDARVAGTLRIKWEASDPDNEPLTYRLTYRLSGTRNPKDLASLGAGSDQYLWDTRTVADGTYEITVRATDGNFEAFDKVQVIIQNSETPIDQPSVEKKQYRPGEDILITAVVTKANAKVVAKVLKDGVVVAEVEMRDDGKEGDAVAGDNIYSARFKVEDGGAYAVDIKATYSEDGVEKEDEFPGAATFTVKLTPGDVLSRFAGLWVALGALTLAVVGVAGYALMRKWRT